MEEKNLDAWKTALMGEILCFGMLGKVIYQYPNKDWINTLVSDNVFLDVPFGEGQVLVQKGIAILSEWTNENYGGISEKEMEAIKKDHLYLFTGVSKPLAPVWESVYFSKAQLLFQKETIQVREWYSRFKLQVERKDREPDDHIGLELGFIAHLAALTLKALEDGDFSTAEKHLQSQRDFLTEHLLRWAPMWAKLVIKNADTQFYRGLAHLTLGTLMAASELLDIDLTKVKKP